MLKTVWQWLKELPKMDQITLGICMAILINPGLATVVAALVVVYYLIRLGQVLAKDLGV